MLLRDPLERIFSFFLSLSALPRELIQHSDFLFNRDVATFPPEAHRELDTLLTEIIREQAGIVSHDHFLYVVRPIHERRLTT